MAPKEEPKAKIEELRAVVRSVLETESLRSVADEIGISRPALSDFVRTDSPRTPYGATRRKLHVWAYRRGLVGHSGLSAESVGKILVREPPAGFRTWAQPRVPPGAYELIYNYCELLDEAGVPEELIDEARRLMSGETFNTLRKYVQGERTEEGWIKDVEAAWAFVRDTLRAQGFDL